MEQKNIDMKAPAVSASGSATGNPRNKVALKPGHSLMDWIRLGQSGVDLTGVNGVRHIVTPEQLAAHNTKDDAWIAIRGMVYNVSRYMDFHPGGHEELMRGVGKDATNLFNEVHAWVNYESILKKCLVGCLKRADSKNEDLRKHLFGSRKKIPLDTVQKVENTEQPVSTSSSSAKPRMDWYQQLSSVTLTFYTKKAWPQVTVNLFGDKEIVINILLCDEVFLWHYHLCSNILWPCELEINRDKIEIKFTKMIEKMWENLGTACDDSDTIRKASEHPEYNNMTVESVIQVTHNTKLFILSNEGKFYNYIPLGQHMRIIVELEGLEIVRSYTPIPPALCKDWIPPDWNGDRLCLMVKEYPNGSMTPWLCSRKPGDSLRLCGPEGKFDPDHLKNAVNLFLLAAGTGVTPMLSLIKWGVDSRNRICQKTNLMFFNCKERDILWKDQMDALQKESSRFSVSHVLSDPDADWTGPRGHVNISLLQDFLPKIVAESKHFCDYFICVCGPIPFTNLSQKLLKELEFSEDQFHCFVG